MSNQIYGFRNPQSIDYFQQRQISKGQSVQMLSESRELLNQADLISTSFNNFDNIFKKNLLSLQSILFMALSYQVLESTFCATSTDSLLGPFFPKEAESKGATPTEYGFILGSTHITMFIVAPAMGKIVARYGDPKLFILFSTILNGCFVIAFGFLTYVTDRSAFIGLCFFCRIMEGICAPIYRILNTSIGASLCPGRESTIFSVFRTLSGVGQMTGPIIGGALFTIGGYKLPFLVMGSVIILNCIALFFALSLTDEKEKEAKDKPSASKFWLNCGTWLFYMILLSSCVNGGYISITLEPHLRQFNLTPVYLGLVFSVKGIVFGVTAPIVGWMIDKTKKHSLFLLVSIVFQILVLLFIGPIPFISMESQLWIVIVACVINGGGSSLTHISFFGGLIDHTVSRGFSKDLNTFAFVTSSRLSAMSLGFFVGPSIGGVLFEQLGYDGSRLVLICAQACLFVATSVFFIAKKIQCPPSEKESNHVTDSTKVETRL